MLVSSAAARVGPANHETIAVAKAGIEALVRAAAASYGGYSIRLNAVAPGLVRTAQTAAITGSEVGERVSTAAWRRCVRV